MAYANYSSSLSLKKRIRFNVFPAAGRCMERIMSVCIAAPLRCIVR